MGRPRAFDIDEAVTDAMDVFWTHGYHGASLPDLLSGMGLTRGSLYKAFTDKKSLFLRVLEVYGAQRVMPAVAMLKESDRDGLLRIGAVFEGVIATAGGGDTRGCLLCSAAAGAAAQDDEIARVVHAKLDLMQEGFCAAIAQSARYAAADEAVQRARAEMVLAQYVGLRILVRARAPLARLEQAAAGTMDALRA